MLRDPGVIGRALEGDVQRELHAVSRGRRTRWSKSARVPSFGMDGLVAAFGEPMAQGLPSSPRPAVTELFGPLRKACADGVDGRHVEDVEAHGGDLGQQGFDVARGFRGGVGSGEAERGKELVPGGEAGAFAVDPELEFFVVAWWRS